VSFYANKRNQQGAVACFGRIDALLSSSGLLSGPKTIRAISAARCARFGSTSWPASLFLNSISAEKWASSTRATADFNGGNVRSNFLTPRGYGSRNCRECRKNPGSVCCRPPFGTKRSLARPLAICRNSKSPGQRSLRV
jgi:hypothetical protein